MENDCVSSGEFVIWVIAVKAAKEKNKVDKAIKMKWKVFQSWDNKVWF